jgi:hypothetical protein
VEQEKMVTKRWAAQIGLLSAAAVFLCSICVLVIHGAESPSGAESNQVSATNSSHMQNLPISLSAASAESSASHH